MIKSILDTDFYKLTQMQWVFHNAPYTICTYEFKCRNDDIDFSDAMGEILQEIGNLEDLSLTSEEREYLESLGLFKKDFLDYLAEFRFDPCEQIKTMCHKDGTLHIDVKGKWLDTILYEVPVLAIVNESYFWSQSNISYAKHVGMKRLSEKIQIAKQMPFSFADFGTRRRYSGDWQNEVNEILSSHKDINFVGTSNVRIAMDLGLNPIGTMAHEYLQACQVLAPSLSETQTFAFNEWHKEYNGKLGIALTDIFGIDAFLADFDEDLANKFDGVRQDSGDPFTFAKKMIDHYHKLGIDPHTKTLVFSDGLDFKAMSSLHDTLSQYTNVVFGIGTNLTNDCGYRALNIVIKMVTCNKKPTVKISDSPGKIMCKNGRYIETVSEMIREKIK